MSLGRQAKMLSRGQLDAALGLVAHARYPKRNRVILLLSVKAGLRAKEIARLKWEMLIDASGEVIRGRCRCEHGGARCA
jgi:integrase